MNNPDVIPIIKGAFERDGSKITSSSETVLKQLESLEQATEAKVKQIEANPNLDAQQKEIRKNQAIREGQLAFEQGKGKIEKRHANRKVEVVSDYPPLNEKMVISVGNTHRKDRTMSS